MRPGRWAGTAGLVAALWGAVVCLGAAWAMAFDPGKAGFSVRLKNETSDYRVLGVYVLPRERLKLEVDDGAGDTAFQVRVADGTVAWQSPRTFEWTAPPRPGLYPMVIARGSTADSMTLNMFVMVPFARVENGYLNGYRIGHYPDKPYKGLPIYRPPRGFIEVSPELLAVPVSPHFTLGQFLCKQEGGFPKYLVLREKLLLKLELILAAMNREGFPCRTFAVLSGFRTPYYNHAIGNVKYSRHQWGGAADIYVDEDPADGTMDDLNGDGRIDWKDADVLYRVVDDMYGEPFYERFVGGLGRYRKTPAHGPFVHVDVRGFRARWGD